MTSTALVNKLVILERVAAGDQLIDIARDLGVAVPNISKHLAGDPDYVAAREVGAEARLIASRQALSQIADLGVGSDGTIIGITSEQANLARAREQRLKADQWFAEREFPHRWGKGPDVVIQTGVSVTEALGQDAATLLDKVRTVSVQSAKLQDDAIPHSTDGII